MTEHTTAEQLADDLHGAAGELANNDAYPQTVEDRMTLTSLLIQAGFRIAELERDKNRLATIIHRDDDKDAERILELERECFALASNQCHSGYGDENGNHQCRLVDYANNNMRKWQELAGECKAERNALAARVAALEQLVNTLAGDAQ